MEESVKKTYEIDFPIVIDAIDYHDFKNIKNVCDDVFKEPFEYEELGFRDLMYMAAFYPKNMPIQQKVFDDLKKDMDLD